jgi:probable biosynthetic protein (TIGR04098 family)
MKLTWDFVCGLPHLDVHTLSEDWVLANGLVAHWKIMADSVGKKPSEWIDSQGDRMYGAVIWLQTSFDLVNVVGEDDHVIAETEITGIRKPHALSVTRFLVDGQERGRLVLLTSFIKRKVRGSNKKFAKVKDLWTAEDFNGEAIDALLDAHHAMKDVADNGTLVRTYEINRIQDFNTADFMYFKNFVRIAKAGEWCHDRGGQTQLAAKRDCFYYGNVEDGDIIETRVGSDAEGRLTAHYNADGKRIFVCRSQMQPVQIAVR